MQNSFTGYVQAFPNHGIHFLLAETVKFRKQLTVRSEFRAQSGWDNAINNYMIAELEKLADTCENITYNPDELSKEELEGLAADTERSLADDYNVRAVASDNVVMPNALDREVVWKLDGSNPDLPQMTVDVCPNDAARTFIAGLDRFFVEATRLDSRYSRQTITKHESVMLRNLLNELYTLTQRKGGEVNKSDISQGTLPTQEPATFQGS